MSLKTTGPCSPIKTTSPVHVKLTVVRKLMKRLWPAAESSRDRTQLRQQRAWQLYFIWTLPSNHRSHTRPHGHSKNIVGYVLGDLVLKQILQQPICSWIFHEALSSYQLSELQPKFSSVIQMQNRVPDHRPKQPQGQHSSPPQTEPGAGWL